jgi:hypothetical protein
MMGKIETCGNYTRIMILPVGVESKNNMGTLNTESMKPEKNSIDAFRPK